MVYGGDQLVMSGATAISATISGGYQDDYGTAIGTTINTSGVQIVEGGGIASGTILNGGVQ